MGFEAAGLPFNIDSFVEEFRIKKQRWTVSTFFDNEYEKRKNLQKIITAGVYKTAGNAFDRFQGNRNYGLENLTPGLIMKFEAFLRKEGCSNNTIYNYIKSLRSLYNIAVDEKVVSKDLYTFYNSHIRSGYKVDPLRTATVKSPIAKSDRRKIMDYKPKELSMEEDAKWFFMFSYFVCGINFKDMAYLKWDENIHGDYIVYTRAKTGHKTVFRIPIGSELKMILDHYKKFDNDGYIFPVFSDFHKTAQQKEDRKKAFHKRINKACKKIGKELGITTELTTYVARYSFVNSLYQNNVNIVEIQKMMGHAEIGTTRIYIGTLTDDALREASKELSLD